MTQDSGANRPVSPVIAGATSNKDRTLLIADDDAAFRNRIARALEQRGFIVTAVGSVAEALAQTARPPAFAAASTVPGPVATPAFALIKITTCDTGGPSVVPSIPMPASGSQAPAGQTPLDTPPPWIDEGPVLVTGPGPDGPYGPGPYGPGPGLPPGGPGVFLPPPGPGGPTGGSAGAAVARPPIGGDPAPGWGAGDRPDQAGVVARSPK